MIIVLFFLGTIITMTKYKMKTLQGQGDFQIDYTLYMQLPYKRIPI